MNWEIKEQTFDNGQLDKLKADTSYSEAFIKMCLARGLDTTEKIHDFIEDDKPTFHDPFLLFDMEKAVSRIKQAIELGETIMIFGDYDADGITSTAILVEALEMLGGNVTYFLPNRFTDGYGPNPALFQSFVDEGAELIITCDNGVTGHESVELMSQQNIDVIITDHHELPDTLPQAHAIIHPKHPEGAYPFGDLSGAGVALKVAAALLEQIPTQLIDLAAIGTVADLVSLTDENRWLVKQGVLLLKQTERIGLHLLFEKASINSDTIDEETIGFLIGPRLNALGRLGDAAPGVELLLSFDEERLVELVDFIQETNTKRQGIVNDIYVSASEKIEAFEELPNIIVLADASWHEGVLGIVASRLVEDTGKPVILLNHNEQTGIMKGSGRSIEAVHLYEALLACSSLLVKFGGHKMAAGMSLEAENHAQFTESLNVYLLPFEEEIEKGVTVQLDEVLSLEEANLTFLKEINLLKPFGTDNPKPVFGFKDVPVQNVKKIGADQKHLKFMFQENKEQLDVIGFNQGPLAEFLTANQTVSAIGELGINTWRDISKPQFQLKDIKVDSVQYFDRRSSKFNPISLERKNSVYLFFNEAFFEKVANHLDASSVAVLLESSDDIPPFSEQYEQLVILDCPTNQDYLSRFLSQHSFQNYYIYAYPVNSIVGEGMATQAQFGLVYKYFRQRENMDVRNRLDALAKYLKIDKRLLIFIISVFLEAKFVTIDNGVLNPTKNPIRMNLEDTEAYQNRVKKIEAEKTFIYSPFSELEEWFNNQESK